MIKADVHHCHRPQASKCTHRIGDGVGGNGSAFPNALSKRSIIFEINSSCSSLQLSSVSASPSLTSVRPSYDTMVSVAQLVPSRWRQTVWSEAMRGPRVLSFDHECQGSCLLDESPPRYIDPAGVGERRGGVGAPRRGTVEGRSEPPPPQSAELGQR